MKKMFSVGGLILALSAAGYWGVSRLLPREPPSCQVCDRPIHPGQEYTLVLVDGAETHACCPRCGMHARRANPGQVRMAWATDFATGEKMSSQQALYVESRDVMTCCTTPALKRGRESTYELVWDRCLPSLTAFKTMADAQQFQRQHGGRVLTYAEAMEGVRSR